MKLLLLTFAIVGLCVFLLCFNIIFRKDGKFPDTEIEHNKEMRKRGIQCAKMEEKKIWGKKNNRNIRIGYCGYFLLKLKIRYVTISPNNY